jgi:hypothetical protein
MPLGCQQGENDMSPPVNRRDFMKQSLAASAGGVLAGMFDFEIAEDVMTLNGILGGLKSRPRLWRS